MPEIITISSNHYFPSLWYLNLISEEPTEVLWLRYKYCTVQNIRRQSSEINYQEVKAGLAVKRIQQILFHCQRSLRSSVNASATGKLLFEISWSKSRINPAS